MPYVVTRFSACFLQQLPIRSPCVTTLVFLYIITVLPPLFLFYLSPYPSLFSLFTVLAVSLPSSLPPSLPRSSCDPIILPTSFLLPLCLALLKDISADISLPTVRPVRPAVVSIERQVPLQLMEPLGAHPLGPFEAAGTLLGVTGGRPEELLVRGVGVLLLLDGLFEVGILGPVLLGPILTFLGIVGNGGGDGVVGAWLLAGVIPHVQVRAWFGGKANSLIPLVLAVLLFITRRHCLILVERFLRLIKVTFVSWVSC